MKRILLLIVRLFWRIPGWLMKIHSYQKNVDKVPFQQRYQLLKTIVYHINKKARVHIHSYGIENLPQEQGYLMTPNHQGLYDALILIETHPQSFKAVLKKELLEVFVLGNVLKMLEFLPIDRQNLRASVKVIRQVTQELNEGINYVIFPEGTRCRRQNEMLEFKGGSFKAAMNAKKPIVPVALIDCYKVFDDNSIRYVDAQVHYLKPLYYEEYQDLSSQDIASIVQERIRKCIQENEGKSF